MMSEMNNVATDLAEMTVMQYESPDVAALDYLVKTGYTLAESQAEPVVIEVEGHTYLVHNRKHTEIKPSDPPAPSEFEAYTLTGLVDIIRTDVDGLYDDETTRHIVRVCNHELVQVLTPLTPVENKRNSVAKCTAKAPKIIFDEYMDVERFIIMVMSRFEVTENREMMLTIVGNLKSEESIKQGDDGFSQRITIRKGIVTSGETTIENPIMLKPMRTFKEIEQPESLFTLRFKEGGYVALFESDGGAWKNEAVLRTKAWLEDQLQGANVVVVA